VKAEPARRVGSDSKSLQILSINRRRTFVVICKKGQRDQAWCELSTGESADNKFDDFWTRCVLSNWVRQGWGGIPCRQSHRVHQRFRIVQPSSRRGRHLRLAVPIESERLGEGWGMNGCPAVVKQSSAVGVVKRAISSHKAARLPTVFETLVWRGQTLPIPVKRREPPWPVLAGAGV